MEIVKGSIDIGNIKRCYVDCEPFRMKCPNCNGVIEYDFYEQYLSYVEINEKEDIVISCDNCEEEGNDFEFSIPIKVISAEITIEIYDKGIKSYV